MRRGVWEVCTFGTGVEAGRADDTARHARVRCVLPGWTLMAGRLPRFVRQVAARAGGAVAVHFNMLLHAYCITPVARPKHVTVMVTAGALRARALQLRHCAELRAFLNACAVGSRP
jgi:hypothetical protein